MNTGRFDLFPKTTKDALQIREEVLKQTKIDRQGRYVARMARLKKFQEQKKVEIQEQEKVEIQEQEKVEIQESEGEEEIPRRRKGIPDTLRLTAQDEYTIGVVDPVIYLYGVRGRPLCDEGYREIAEDFIGNNFLTYKFKELQQNGQIAQYATVFPIQFKKEIIDQVNEQLYTIVPDYMNLAGEVDYDYNLKILRYLLRDDRYHFQSMTENNSGVYIFCPKVRWVSGGNAILMDRNVRFESFDPQQKFKQHFEGLNEMIEYKTEDVFEMYIKDTEDGYNYDFGDFNIELRSLSDAYHEILDLFFQAERNEGSTNISITELQRITRYFNSNTNTEKPRELQIEAGQILGQVVIKRVKDSNDDLKRTLTDFVFNLRMNSADELNHFRSAFDAAGKANKSQINRTSLLNLPADMQMEEVTTDLQGLTADLRINYPFIFESQNEEEERVLQTFTTVFIYHLSFYTQFPQVKGIGVLSPSQIFFLWSAFTEILTVIIKNLLYNSKQQRNLRPLAIYLFRMLKPHNDSVGIFKIKDDEILFVPAQPYGNPVRDLSAFQLTIIPAFREFLKYYAELFREVREAEFDPNRNTETFNKIVTIDRTPVNLNQFNREFVRGTAAPRQRLSFPVNTQFKRLFNEQLDAEMRKINMRHYQEQFDKQQRFTRAIDFEIIDISSETSGQLALEVLRTQIADKVSDIYFTLNSFSYDQIDKIISGWTIFIGLEIITIRRDELGHLIEIDADDDINTWLNNADQRVVRMAHCNVQLSNLGRTGGGDYKYFFGNARAYFRNKAKQPDRRPPDVDIRGAEYPRDRDDIGINDSIAEVMQFLKDLEINEQLGAFDDTSGPVDQDAQFDFVDSAQFISKITLFTMPVYQNVGQVVPLRASIKHSPIVFNNLDYRLLQEQEITDQIIADVMQNDLQQFDNPLNDFSYFTCIKMTLYFILNRLEISKLQAYKMCKDFEGTIKDMLNLILEKAEEPYRSSIVLFFTEGCVLTFHHESQFTPKISDFMRDQKYNQHPILCIRNQTSQQGMAHIFPTVLRNVKDFIKAIGNFSMRQMKNDKKRRPHPGFVLKAAAVPKGLPQPFNQDAYRKKIMNQVWTLDIETISAPGKPMEPYCIVVWNGKIPELQIISDPKNTVEEFQNWLSILKFRRSEIPEQELDDLHIYAHNGSRFDWVILLRSVLRVFPDTQLYGTVTNIKAMIVRSIKLKFLDFILMVPGSLDKISKAFDVQHQQMECQQIKGKEFYYQITSTQKEQILNYCVNDTKCLWDCVEAFLKQVIELMNPHYELPIQNVLPITNSSLAQEVFKFKFQLCGDFKGTTCITIDAIQTNAYFGGMTQAFNFHKLKNVYYIDVNSLYPYAMTEINVSTEPGRVEDVKRVEWEMKFPWEPSEMKKIYNNCLYNVETFIFWEHSPGLLPVRCPDGSLCYPQLSGVPCWRTGWEINALLQSQLLKLIRISHVLYYPDVNTGAKPFQNYVDTVYQMKRDAKNDVKKTLYKLLLNQLYGKFAQRSYPKIKVVRMMDVCNDPSLPAKLAREEINAAILCDLMDHDTDLPQLEQLWGDASDPESKQLKSKYIPVISGVNQVDKNNEFIQLTMEKSVMDIQRVGMLQRISIMTTGCARAHMIKAFGFLHNKFEQDILKHVHYMDTDSLFVSAEGQETLARMMDEKQLGKFKLEIPCKIVHMQIFGNKVYFAEPEQGPMIFKFKGISSKYIKETLKTDEQRKQLFYDIFSQKLPQQTQTELWKRQFGAVIISEATQINTSKPRREVKADGTSVSYISVVEYLEAAAKYRLVRRGNEMIGYKFHYHPIEKDLKK